jgi:hypothetical protein
MDWDVAWKKTRNTHNILIRELLGMSKTEVEE